MLAKVRIVPLVAVGNFFSFCQDWPIREASILLIQNAVGKVLFNAHDGEILIFASYRTTLQLCGLNIRSWPIVRFDTDFENCGNLFVAYDTDHSALQSKSDFWVMCHIVLQLHGLSEPGIHNGHTKVSYKKVSFTTTALAKNPTPLHISSSLYPSSLFKLGRGTMKVSMQTEAFCPTNLLPESTISDGLIHEPALLCG